MLISYNHVNMIGIRWVGRFGLIEMSWSRCVEALVLEELWVDWSGVMKGLVSE